MKYKVRIKDFEGPLDLLVYLIESAKMDIYDIHISTITRQYIEYINEAITLNVEFSTEFMIMASTLIDLKSRMLLPSREIFDEEEFEDPRDELVHQILEYKKIKRISEFLRTNELDSFNKITKPAEDLSLLTGKEIEVLKVDGDLFIRQFKLFLDKKVRLNQVSKKYGEVKDSRMTTSSKLEKIKSFFKKFGRKKIDFSALIENKSDRYEKALTFSSILEMVNKNKVIAIQKKTYGNIEVSATTDFLDEINGD